MTTKKPSTTKGDVKELDALAHHLAEALRIMRTSEVIPTRIYNYFSDAYNELCGLSLTPLWETEEFARPSWRI